ncbi:GNAT family N-acetyltransferase, partial [Streptomyces sp. NPDC127110]
MRISVPAGSPGGLRLAAALGYTEYSRNLAKELPAAPPALSEGVLGRPMTPDEYEAWVVRARAAYAASWVAQGMPEEAARAKSRADHDAQLPGGLATPGVTFAVLEAAGTPDAPPRRGAGRGGAGRQTGPRGPPHARGPAARPAPGGAGG